MNYFFLRFVKWLFLTSGLLAILFFFLSFTSIPYHAYHYLGTCNAKLYHKPGLIVLLGGGGMPSPDGLMRCYYTAEAAKENTNARIIIALPCDERDSASQLQLMRRELILRGIDSSRISFEPRGFNTHSQAENIAALFGTSLRTTALLIITSPEHMYRSVKTFQKAGFANVGGVAAFEDPIDEEQITDKQNNGDTRVKSVALRYNMWSYMNYELLAIKEYCAITYYKLMDWI